VALFIQNTNKAEKPGIFGWQYTVIKLDRWCIAWTTVIHSPAT